jgi:predicted RNA binding protein with dsRBD fold (UPF0201 family)
MSKQKVKKQIDTLEENKEIQTIKQELYRFVKIIVEKCKTENGLLKAKNLLRFLHNNFY